MNQNVDKVVQPHVEVQVVGFDAMMRDVIDIFNLEGVNLVRLSGLHRREVRVSGDDRLSPTTVELVVDKLRRAKVINFRFKMRCPTCGEVFYQIIAHDVGAKLCDTCSSMFVVVKEEVDAEADHQ